MVSHSINLSLHLVIFLIDMKSSTNCWQRFSSVAQSCLTLCDPMNCSTPGLPVHHQLPEFTQTHVHWVGDVIQPAHHFRHSYTQQEGLQCFSVQFSCYSVVSNSLWPHEPQHTRPPCPSPTPGVHPNPCPLSWWCHPTISSSVVPFSSCPQSFPASGSFQMSQFSAPGGQRIGVSASASVPPMNTQDWSPLGLSGLISLQFKGFSRVFSNTTVQNHQFVSTQLSL